MDENQLTQTTVPEKYKHVSAKFTKKTIKQAGRKAKHPCIICGKAVSNCKVGRKCDVKNCRAYWHLQCYRESLFEFSRRGKGFDSSLPFCMKVKFSLYFSQPLK